MDPSAVAPNNAIYSTGTTTSATQVYFSKEKPHWCNEAGTRFENVWGIPDFKIFDVVKWQVTRKSAPMPTKEEIRERYPFHQPKFVQCQALKGLKEIVATWIGHATFVVQMNGVTFLTDPIWSQRCSPVSFAGEVRYTDVPCQLTEIPPVDFVLISHTHYDHLDINTIKKVFELHPECKFYIPLMTKNMFVGLGIPKEQLFEMDWWDATVFESKDENKFRIIYTPTQHFSRRGMFDHRKMLWGSWIVEDVNLNKKIYFAGDTGYCPVFQEIGEKFGPFDLGLLPIGAYLPRFFMKINHVNPEEAVQLHLDLKCRKSIAMHYGTFTMQTDEHIFEPPQLLEKYLIEKNIPKEDFVCIGHGETYTVT